MVPNINISLWLFSSVADHIKVLMTTKQPEVADHTEVAENEMCTEHSIGRGYSKMLHSVM